MILSSKFILFFLSNSVFIKSIVGESDCNSQNDNFYASQVILFFAPKQTSAIKEQLAIYYNNPGFIRGDKVAIYKDDNLQKEPFMIYSFNPIDMKGIKYTQVAPVSLSYSVNSTFKNECLGYYGAWLRDGVIKQMNCLSTHPNWMSDMKEVFKNEILSHLIIPGTHNSGSYSEANTQSIVQQFTVTQDSDILGQLISGARYFDLRPSFTDTYWINHGPYYINPMIDIIHDVKEFMNNTNEIVIISFKEFSKGFKSDKQHLHFINYLETEFVDYLLQRKSAFGWGTTLGQIWEGGKRLILSYDHQIYKRTTSMWPPIVQNWGNVQHLDDLKNYLIANEGMYSTLRASMAELTLNHWMVIKHSVSHFIGDDKVSLRRLGGQVGPHVTRWYNELFYDTANIVAVDFIDGTGIVDVAIQWNQRRFSPCYNYYREIMKSNTTNQN